jgi:DNA-binding protein HU-beta
MNRSELITAVSAHSGVPLATADQVLASLQAVIVESLLNEEKVTIPGFLALDVVERSARTGRNPKTGAPLEIPARKAVRIAAGHGLKRAVSELPASGN